MNRKIFNYEWLQLVPMGVVIYHLTYIYIANAILICSTQVCH